MIKLTEKITQELREKIEPYLRERVDEDLWNRRDEMFEEVVYTQPEVIPLVTLKPLLDNTPAMQFSCITGELMELTDWDYIQTVDYDAQIEEHELRESIELVCSILRFYHHRDYRSITDYEKAYNNRVELKVNEDTVYRYDLPFQTIYLNSENYPITLGDQLVQDNKYYYNFDDEETDTDDPTGYTYICRYEWKRNKSGDE